MDTNWKLKQLLQYKFEEYMYAWYKVVTLVDKFRINTPGP